MNDTYDTNVWSVLERIRNQGLEDYEYEEFNDTDDEPEGCFSEMSEFDPIFQQFRFWFEGVLSTLVGVLGFSGNLTAVLILLLVKSKTTFVYLILSLSLVDALFIVTSVLDVSMIGVFEWPISSKSGLYNSVFPIYMRTLSGILVSASIHLTVAISIERFIAVCRPLYYLQQARTNIYLH
ncbi:FMRFamide receptor [Eurytemora carolleeae]|uniref:FMRFamide receptor n=1 Tax=Eurytemora carolleeae TaxID=1294199 RepID=UPI000C75A2A1|nr:FMRFamide receptor [Eurytemora carolleeae]|eukprot:XP_023338878.1 FMRFamide receptor-like [Eurytemora affinis]